MVDTPFRDPLKALLIALGSKDQVRRQRARQETRDFLAANQRSWNDLVACLHFGGSQGERLKKLFALLGQDNDGEFENAREKLSALLAGEHVSWTAFVDSLCAGYRTTSGNRYENGQDRINALDVVHHLLGRYVGLSEHQSVAVALWIVHTFVYHRFTVTPRLLLTSPVRGCGKTTLLDVIEALCARPLKSDHITPAGLYYAIDRKHATLLIDEADNLGLASHATLRAILNSGHRKGGAVTRYRDGEDRSFSTFAPVVVSAIGTLPLPLMHRSIVIHMERHDGRRELKRLDKGDVDTKADLNIAYGMAFTWSRNAELSSDPPLPVQLRNRLADNWRPLIAIADGFGADWPMRARQAALALAGEHWDEDAAIILLCDVREMFDGGGVDRLPSKTIVDQLNAAGDAIWSEWRGTSGDQQPRKLSQGELAKLLAPFRIRPQTIRTSTEAFRGRPTSEAGTKPTVKGYYRAQFEAAWRSYCRNTVTPSQPGKFRHLRTR
jgi:Protein of unknown function (DUF3631)